MIKSIQRVSSALFLVLSASTVQAEAKKDFESLVEPFLVQHCLECHDEDVQKGDVALHDLLDVSVNNASLWIRVWESVALKEMPPKEKKKKVMPSLMERLEISDWITAELERTMENHGGFSAHQLPAKGNHLDHDLLFGKLPETSEPASTPARIWRISPQEHMNRLSNLVSYVEPYNPATPGKRARGDHIPPDKYGDVKIYYGMERIIGNIGGYVAYETALKAFPSVLTHKSVHGLRNYPSLYSVNGSEAAQISSLSKDILHYMAYGPDALPHQYVNSMKEVDKKHMNSELRGLPQSLFYKKETMRALTPVYHLVEKGKASDRELKEAVAFLFEALTYRPPTNNEVDDYVALAKQSIQELGFKDGFLIGLSPIFLDRDALFRSELAEYGKPDSHGRVMLQGDELMLALNAAFCYSEPDEGLRKALNAGKLKTKKDVEREVLRYLETYEIRKPKIVQFFREYFDYDYALKICKDDKALLGAGGSNRNMASVSAFEKSMLNQIGGTDRLVEEIVKEDKQVLKELLTTNRVVLNVQDDWRQLSRLNAEAPEQKELKERLARYKAEDKKFLADGGNKEELKKIQKKRGKKNQRLPVPKAFLASLGKEQKPVHVKIYEGIASRSDKLVMTTLPKSERMGILTQPSWLVSHSDAMDNHAILRGKWVRERLLGGAVPDVPITVDAMLPDEPGTSLRHRMRVTLEEECWRCHDKMDPLGLPFEMFNHIGRYVDVDPNSKVDASGEIIDSGDPSLDGPVENALDMIERLAASERVEQVFVRHVFRYWMGRNETLNDAKILQEAHKAYKDNNGSLKALLVSLLTSDAFLYRKVES